MERKSLYVAILGIVITCALAGALVYGYIAYTTLQAQYGELEKGFAEYQMTLTEKDEQILNLEAMATIMKRELALSEENRTELVRLLDEEKARNEDFEDQINDISGTVGKLDKLSKTDPELLMKYSKVYFLNEHYAPERVVEIASTSRFKTNEPEYVHEEVASFLEDMIEEAKEDDVELLVVSAYRSFDEQRFLKSTYSVQYGSGANTFSADQGYSEHQLGTTVDFTTRDIGGGLAGFEKTDAYAWLLKYAYRYGFVLSYPERNGYYIFEPWHWRFVGEDLARELHRRDMYFYDMDQREIDSYLISIFD